MLALREDRQAGRRVRSRALPVPPGRRGNRLVSKPPPEDLKDWSKNMLVREVQRLRAVLREHAERPGGDPREAATTGSAITDVAGDPHARGGVILDARAAVLMEGVDVALFDTKQGERVAMMMTLSGRINYSTDRVEHAYMFGPDGAAGLVSELVGLASRAGGAGGHGERFAAEFQADLERRMKELP
jgi:hypothetical protein